MPPTATTDDDTQLATLRWAAEEARNLMAQHGLGFFWRFEFDNALSRFGCCRFRDKVITLSRHLVPLNTRAEVRDKILHEIAHALAGYAAGHGPNWKLICLRIGARPERCHAAAAPPERWGILCTDCDQIIDRRHRRAARLPRAFHIDCPKSPRVGQLTWRDLTVTVDATR